LQNGDGYVDSEAKLKKIIDSIAAALGSKWCCNDANLLAMYTMVCISAMFNIILKTWSNKTNSRFGRAWLVGMCRIQIPVSTISSKIYTSSEMQTSVSIR
jgi:hypothetical protein